MADDDLLQAVRGLHLANPELGPKPLLAKLREQQPDLAAGNKEVREALAALKAEESKATEAASAPSAAAAPPATAAPAAAEERGAPPDVAISLACFGCGRLPSEMGDGREKHPVCPVCRKLKVPTTYWCCVNCPGNPGAWTKHTRYHKRVKRHQREMEDGGEWQQRQREAAEVGAHIAAELGDAYAELLAEGGRYASQHDHRRAARAFREAIALEPDEPEAHFDLGAALNNSAHYVEAAQWLLEARERSPAGSEMWALSTAAAFVLLAKEEGCAEVAKPEWWNDEELKALSARVVRAAPDDLQAHQMRAIVLAGQSTLEAGPRSAAKLREAAMHYDRAAALHPALAMKAALADNAERCRSQAEIIHS